MNKRRIICCAASVAVTAVMALTALGVSAIAGNGNAYIPADTETDGIAGDQHGGGTADDDGNIRNDGTRAPEGSGSTNSPVGTNNAGNAGNDPAYRGEDEGDLNPPDETTVVIIPGAGSALGGLSWNDPPMETTFETGIIVIPETTDTDIADSETAPPEPETTAPDTETAPAPLDTETDPSDTETDPTPPETETEPSVTEPYEPVPEPEAELTSITLKAVFEPLCSEAFEAMRSEAEKYIGTKYVWGGSSPTSGFDCSGYVSWVLNHSGWSIGRTSSKGLFELCKKISKSEAQPGDLVFFANTYTSGISHVGIYLGDGKMIDCSTSVQIDAIDSGYWAEHFYSFGRLPNP